MPSTALCVQKGRECRLRTITEHLGKRRLFFEGAMGTMLQEAGLPDGYLPDLWSVENTEAVKSVHRQYLKAGCTILKTNTFGANALKLAPHGYTVAEVVSAAVGIAAEAIAEEKAEAFIALDIGPTGKLLKPLGDLYFEDAVELFKDMVKVGAQAGADAILIETMSDSYELKAAVLAAKEASDLPIFCTVVFDEHGQLLTGADIVGVTAMLEGLGVSAVGMNCGLGPQSMLPLVRRLREYCSLPVIVNPNAGLPRSEKGKTVFDVTPQQFAENMRPIAEEAAILGGCCGTTPAHLKAMIDVCKAVDMPVTHSYERLLVSSYATVNEIGSIPTVIGERINPTGKKRFKQALLEDDMSYILHEAVDEEEGGAHILDVNVGLPEIDECERLPRVVQELQKVTALPLQLDTSNADAMERALRVYNGKALINSVNGKEESLQAILPLVKHYGGGVIALTLDENGIPSTAEGRLAIARKIVERAEAVGIPRREILVDVLTLPVSADPSAARVTLEALRLVKQELGVKTVLGVSNVSFGLPSREQINAAFLNMAVLSGLDAAIINPKSYTMMQSIASSAALLEKDEHFERYIASNGDSKSSAVSSAPLSEVSLKEAVIKDLSSDAAKLTEAELEQGSEPLHIIDEQLVPALDYVGQGFEEGRVFLPQLLMSAEAAKAAFEVLKSSLSSTEATSDARTVVIATVEGDIHDIGKNIVKVMLENYQFRVVDLGKDVPAQTIVDAAVREHADIVGLSALMTTTVPAMEQTIRLLRQQAPFVKVLVGGAVLTEDYAVRIGADAYAKDAMAAVQYAKSLG